MELCGRLCEVFTERGDARRLLAKDVRIARLESGAVVARGRDKIAQAMQAAPPASAQATALARIEAAPAASTLCLATFAPGAAPGLTPRGLAPPAGKPQPPAAGLAVLVRAAEGVIDQLWVGGAVSLASREALEASRLWPDCLEVVTETLVGPAGGSTEVQVELGEEVWRVGVDRPADHYFR